MSIAFFNKFYLFGQIFTCKVPEIPTDAIAIQSFTWNSFPWNYSFFKRTLRRQGRRSIVELLKEELRLEHPDEGALNKLVEREVKSKERDTGEGASLEDLSDEQKKGVVFILDHIRKMKKYQSILKSHEIMNLYKRTFSSGKQAGNDFKASKGILVNKKQF